MQVIVYAPNATTILLDRCSTLEHVLIWSEQLTDLAFTGCDAVQRLDLRCPRLASNDHTRFLAPARQPRPEHPPLRDIVAHRLAAADAGSVAERGAYLKLQCTPAGVPEVFNCGGGMPRIGCA